MSFKLRRVISGGQTGVDQAGLYVAHYLGFLTGGTAPKGWRTDDGPMEEVLKGYGLRESNSFTYGARTRANVVQSDGTVWFGNPKSPGGRLTLRLCCDYERPYLVNPTWQELREWLVQREIVTLNVAGNRRRTNPEAGKLAGQVLRFAFNPPAPL